MKIDGNERISICYEDEFGKITIENYTLNEIVNYIVAQLFADLQLDNNNYKNRITKYIIINGKKYNLKTDIHMEFEISFFNVPLVCKDYFTKNYYMVTEFEIKDFYKKIAETAEYYAYDLDTDINNIKINTVRLEILKVYEEEGKK